MAVPSSESSVFTGTKLAHANPFSFQNAKTLVVSKIAVQLLALNPQAVA